MMGDMKIEKDTCPVCGGHLFGCRYVSDRGYYKNYLIDDIGPRHSRRLKVCSDCGLLFAKRGRS